MPKIPSKRKAKLQTITVKNQRCLMITLPEQRTLFTEESNYPELIEYARTFGAQISIVRVEQAELHKDLESLVSSLCKQNQPLISDLKYEIIETKILPKNTPTIVTAPVLPQIPTIPQKSVADIQHYFKTRLMTGNLVNIQGIYQEVKTYRRYDEVYNALQRAKKELKNSGWIVEKIERGCYKAYLEADFDF